LCNPPEGSAYGHKLVGITADLIEDYLRRRLRQRVRRKLTGGYREHGILKSSTVHQEFRVLRRMLSVAVQKKLLPANPCSGVEFPVAVKGLFRPNYVSWSEQRTIEVHAPEHLRNIVKIITETGLRIYKELIPLKKEQLDFTNATVWIPDSKTPNGVAEVPLTPLAVDAFRDQVRLSPCSPYLFPSDQNPSGHKRTLKTTWEATLRRAKVMYFRIYDLRSTYATRLSAGGVADEWAARLGAGELGAIAVAHFRRAMVVSNDAQARNAAIDHGIEVSGSLGVLQSAVTAGTITAARAVQIMENMVLAGAWFSDELIEIFRSSVLKNQSWNTRYRCSERDHLVEVFGLSHERSLWTTSVSPNHSVLLSYGRDH
jgi:integrase